MTIKAACAIAADLARITNTSVSDSWYTEEHIYQESQNVLICDELGNILCYL
jgi:hypothetical protein